MHLATLVDRYITAMALRIFLFTVLIVFSIRQDGFRRSKRFLTTIEETMENKTEICGCPNQSSGRKLFHRPSV